MCENIIMFNLLILLYFNLLVPRVFTEKTIEELELLYEDDKNAMIALETNDNINFYEDFYDEFDPRTNLQQSMNIIFFGSASSFMRIDAESMLHIFIHTKSHLIPVSRALLAWDIITDGKTAAYLQGREYIAFGSLLNSIPEEDLYYVNFGDPSVLDHFSRKYINLNNRKIGVLVSAYRRYFGDMWYNNITTINQLGYLICGFPSYELQKISPSMFTQINTNVLSRLRRCNANQTKTLYNTATHPQAYGDPYRWSSHEIIRLDQLFNCIPTEDIDSIHLEAISAISPSVIKTMKQEKLYYFTKEQIQRMNPTARRIFILRMQLSNSLDKSVVFKGGNAPVLSILALTVNIIIKLI